MPQHRATLRAGMREALGNAEDGRSLGRGGRSQQEMLKGRVCLLDLGTCGALRVNPGRQRLRDTLGQPFVSKEEPTGGNDPALFTQRTMARPCTQGMGDLGLPGWGGFEPASAAAQGSALTCGLDTAGAAPSSQGWKSSREREEQEGA